MGDQPRVKITTPEEFRNWARDQGAEIHSVSSILRAIPGNARADLTELILNQGFDELFWAVRENLRLVVGEYASISFSPSTTTDHELYRLLRQNILHVVHMSKDEPGYIAYTPDATYGKQDRRLKTTVGRYLKKFNPTLSDIDLQRLTDAYRYHFGVEDIKWATTLEDKLKVYAEGPSSCMSHACDDSSGSKQRYGSHIHPVHAYDVPWLKIAYLVRDGRINSRSLVYENPDDPADKRYIRIYGDDVLRLKLEGSGYKMGNLKDAKLKLIPAQKLDGTPLPSTWVVPYIDDQTHGSYRAVTPDGDYLRVVEGGSVANAYVPGTTGITGLNNDYLRCYAADYRVRGGDTTTTTTSQATAQQTHTCGDCEGVFVDNDLEWSGHHDMYVCDNCRENYRVANTGPYSTDLIHEDNTIYVEQTDDYYRDDHRVLEACGLVYLSHPAYDDCEDGERWIRRSDAVVTNDGACLMEDIATDFRGVMHHGAYVAHTATDLVFAASINLEQEATLFVHDERIYTYDSLEDPKISVRSVLEKVVINYEPAQRHEALCAAFAAETSNVHDLLIEALDRLITEPEWRQYASRAAQPSFENFAEAA